MVDWIYRLIAHRDGEKVILAEYRGKTDGLYAFDIERVEKGIEVGEWHREWNDRQDEATRRKLGEAK